MALVFAPTTHVAPITATVSGTNIEGLCGGCCMRLLGDQWAAAYVFLPTGVSSDGFPTGMMPFPTGTGTVT